MYALYSQSWERRDWLRRRLLGVGELASPYHIAAESVLERGFDGVIHGHTHRAEDVVLGSGRYVNAGNWMRESTYVEIDRGEVRLRRWPD